MEIPEFVKKRGQDIAQDALEGKIILPMVIPGSAQFYVAEEEDQGVTAFGGFQLEGKTFKIGTKK